MRQNVRRATLLMSLAVTVCSVGQARQARHDVLLGSEHFDTEVTISWDDDIRGLDHETVEKRLNTVQQLTLRKAGLALEDGEPAFWIRFQVLYGGSAIVYRWDSGLYGQAATIEELGDILGKNEAAFFRAASASPEGELPDIHQFRSRQWKAIRDGTSFGIWDYFSFREVRRGPSGLGSSQSENLREAMERKTRELTEDFLNDVLAARQRLNATDR